MDLVETLRSSHDEVVQDAVEALARAHLRDYDAAGEERVRRLLDRWFGTMVECLSSKSLAPMSSHAEVVAQERFAAKFDIRELQTFVNVLEEATWHVVVPELPLDDLTEAMGKIGTVLGVGRNTLARTWVSLATGHEVPSLDRTGLFEGPEV